MNLSGEVKRNVTAAAQSLTLDQTAKVGGDLSYRSHNDASIASGAVVSGKTTKTLPQARPARHFVSVWMGLFTVLSTLVVALALVLLFPQAIHAVSTQAVTSPWKTVLVGFVASLAAPAVILILMVTIIDIPLAFLTLGAWLLIVALSGVVSAYYVGRLAWKNQPNPVLLMLAGTMVLLTLSFIPIINIVVFLATFLMGTGMLLLEAKRCWPTPKYRVK